MMTISVEEAFEQCWSAFLQGEPFESCLHKFPELSADLRPLLEAALDAHELGEIPVPATRTARSRNRVLNRASELRRPAASQHRPFAFPRVALAGIAVVAILSFAGSGLVVASAASLPGEALYPVKLAVERVQIGLALNATTQLSLASSFEQRRVDEVGRLLALGRVARVQFEGRLESSSGDSATVDGVPVKISPATTLSRDLKPGDAVVVAGDTHPAGWVMAASILRTGQQFFGQVDSIEPDTWRVSGRTVRLAPDTVIDEGISLGDRVSVQLKTEAGFSVASSIHLIERNLGLPTPTEIQKETVSADHPAPTASKTAIEDHEQETSTPQPESLEDVTITGKVQERTQSRWIVDDQTVAISGETEIDSSIEVGDTVEVSGTRDESGVVNAQRIRLVRSNGDSEDGQESEFTGRVQSMSSSEWEIAGRTVQVDSGTVIEGSPHVGDRVQVQVVTNSDGSLRALKIERQGSESEGQSTSTPSHDD